MSAVGNTPRERRPAGGGGKRGRISSLAYATEEEEEEEAGNEIPETRNRTADRFCAQTRRPVAPAGCRLAAVGVCTVGVAAGWFRRT